MNENLNSKNWTESLSLQYDKKTENHSKNTNHDFVGKLRFFTKLPIITTFFAFAMSVVGIIYSVFYNFQIAFFITGCVLLGICFIFFVRYFKYIGKTRGNTNLVYLLSAGSVAVFALEILTSLNPINDIFSDRILFGLFVACFIVQIISFLFFNCGYAHNIKGNKFIRFAILGILIVSFLGCTSYSAIEAFAYDYSRFSVSQKDGNYTITEVRAGVNKKLVLNLEHDGKDVSLGKNLFDKTYLRELEIIIPKDYKTSFEYVFDGSCKLENVYLKGDYSNPELIINGFLNFNGNIYMDDDKYEMLTKHLHEKLKTVSGEYTFSMYATFLSKLHSNQGTKFITYITFGTPYYFEPTNISNNEWYFDCEDYIYDGRVREFNGWYKDVFSSEQFSKSDKFNESTLVFGQWLNRYEITYSLQPDEELYVGGEKVSSNTQYYLENAKTVNLYEAKKEGYHFAGWSTSSSGTNVINSLSITSKNDLKDYTYYPVFERIYSIKYMNGDEELTGLSPTEFYKSYGSFSVPTPNVSKKGYHYGGWDTTYESYTENQVINLGKYTENLVFNLCWMPNIYNLHYDSNGGSKVFDKTVEFDSTIDFLTVNCEKEGYNFLGWKINGEGDFLSYYKWEIDGDITVQAQWEPIVYNVSFDSDGGSSVSNTTITYEDYPNFESPTRVGYTFIGWFNGNTQITSDKKWNIPSDITLVAKWEANKFIASFDSNGGSEINSRTITYDSYVSLEKPSRKGYTFDYWMLNDSPVIDYDGFEWKYASDTEFVAHWTPNIYFITFKVSDTEEYDNIQVAFDSVPILVSNPTKANYNFEGWLYNGELIDLNQTYTFDHDITVYAKWVGQERTITFDSAGGSECENIVVRYGESCQLPTPTRTGYGFKGWYFDGVKFNQDYTCDLSENVTLTANWVPNYYKITYDTNGGSCSVLSAFATYDSPLVLPIASRTGYTFDGWFIDDVLYENNSVWKFTSDKTAIAHWTPVKCTISFDSTGGDAVAPMEVTYDTEVTLPVPTRTGYDFVEWQYNYIKVDQTGICRFEIDVTFKAVWKAKEYTVNFDNEISRTATYDSPFALPDVQMTGFTFNGWFIDGVKYENNSVWKYTFNKYAESNWTANIYSLSFDTDGGATLPSRPVTFSTIVDLPVPVKTGYEFVEWQYNSAKIDMSFTWKFDHSITVKAIWRAKQYDVDFGGGVVKKATYGQTFNLPSGPSEEGYDFAGWEINGKTYNEPFVWNIDSNATATIVFTPKTFNVTFDSAGGTPVDSMTAVYNEGFFLPDPPSKEGYTFAGWSFNGDIKTDTFLWKYLTDMTAVAQWVLN